VTVSDAEEHLDGLDDSQRSVATAQSVPVAVIAGPGTGKTRTIAHRLAYGCATGDIDPSASLAVTFTTRAAAELRTRLRALGGTGVQIRTFHSAALAQAQHFWPLAYGAALPRVCDSAVGLIEDVLPRFALSGAGLARDVAQEIAWTKQANVLPEDYERMALAAGRRVPGVDPDRVTDLLLEYERIKQGRGLIDLDDILLCAAAVLEESDEAARQMRRRYRHFVVDEFQDVSPIQSRLVDLWLGPHQDICVVGDPAQTIHGFAGARSEYLLHFAADHCGTERVELTHNYRSTPQILAVANAVIHGHGGVVLQAATPPGPPVVWSEEPNDTTEAAGAAVWLADRGAAGLPWSQMAVLYRSHAQAETVSRALEARAIPYRVVRPSGRLGVSEESTPLSDPKVTCCTLHSAKGREWEAVAVIGVHEGALPHSRAWGAGAIAEERRLLYVGLTRARRHLLVSWARTSVFGGRAAPSRFLVEAGLVR
jgi:DNA helicase-2/ATP-dependent DNA helicase PcrA